MAHQNLTPSENQIRRQEIPELNLLLPTDQFDVSLWQSLRRQIHDWRHPEKLPPLHLTSKPVPVREIWGSYNYKKNGALGSTVLHVLAIGGIIAVSLAGARVVKEVKHRDGHPGCSRHLAVHAAVFQEERHHRRWRRWR